MNLGRCQRRPIPDAAAISLVVATGALRPTNLEMSAAPTLSLRCCAVLKPEAVEVVVVDVAESGRDAAVQLVDAQKQVIQIAQVLQRRWYLAGQLVVVELQTLQVGQVSQN